MKTIAVLFLLTLAGAVLARPSLITEEDTRDGTTHLRSPPFSSEDTSASVEETSPQEPLVLPKETPATATASTDSVVIRNRRSPKDNDKDKNRGGAGVDIRREQGRGTVVRGDARGTVYDGDRVKVDAYGDWTKTVDGPGRAKPSYGGGFRVEW